MLINIQEILGYSVDATDGEVGELHDIYFDDAAWRTRYLLARTAGWLPGRIVLLAPEAAGRPDWRTERMPVSLTRAQIESSPPLADSEPVSRRQETLLVEHFGWQPWWPTGRILARGEVIESQIARNTATTRPTGTEAAGEDELEEGDPHLRSVREVTDYAIAAQDGHIGHVVDFILDDETWEIRYLAVDTRTWFPGGKKVLVSPAWIEEIDWSDRQVKVDMSREQIKDAPEYDPSEPVNREFESRLYDYHGRPKYWEG